jgi:hypothetical protein
VFFYFSTPPHKLSIGVAHDENKKIKAHAWLSSGEINLVPENPGFTRFFLCMSVFYPNEENLHLLRPNFYCPCRKGCKNSKLVKDFRISAPFRVGEKRYSDSI